MATINKENLIQLWKKIKSYVEEKLEDYPSTEQLPQAIEEALAGKNLPNPNSLVFTGAVSAEYDGSQPVTVEIPEGGGGTSGGGSGSTDWELVGGVELTEEVATIDITLSTACKEILIIVENLGQADTTITAGVSLYVTFNESAAGAILHANYAEIAKNVAGKYPAYGFLSAGVLPNNWAKLICGITNSVGNYADYWNKLNQTYNTLIGDNINSVGFWIGGKPNMAIGGKIQIWGIRV